ncbi:MAG: S9 family peptidase [candidate division KSB1 bacterium]|nr:S9 family peptidase [candidate division KSB1 bacterium]MDZ7273946.1 S9 family peptidase [candidate division KSB1 bacterium]MDZ7286102.1 S9 family peptidase [candidate division KSB1 bacterium]MDZ7299134.1 S9 family peptidase [candidate division KSB1 bacterium]MDZ7308331.1 S9 family peptidase [candidate division KSB1 bacterium]
MRVSTLSVGICLFVLSRAFDPAFTQETHPFTVHDLLAMDRISETQVSPDGKWAVFTLRKTDLEANRGRTDIWVVAVDGTGLRQLTAHPGSDFSPVWSRDSKSIWFLSSRSGSTQVWCLPLDGGEAVQKTSLPLDVGSFQLSPDGRLLALTMEVFPDCATLACTPARLQEQQARKASGRLYEKLFIRHWDAWKDGRRSHLFVMPAAGGETIDVMKGMDADCPSKPFGGAEEYTFTPDSRGVVFTARVAGREEAWSTNFDLYLAPVDGSAPPKNLTAGNPAWDTQPVFSPDGKTLAYLAMARPGYESDRFRIVLQPWPEGAHRVLTEPWDRSPGGVTWSADGRTIYTTANNLGQNSLFAIDVASGKSRIVVEKGTVRSVGVAGNRLLFAMDHHRSPVELYTVLPNGTGVRTVTRINAEKLAKVRMGESEQFTFKGWNDETVYAYVVKPVDFNPAQKYPVAFLIHGGPQGSFGNDFHYRWNPQTYAGAGYAAVMVDFHGSTGYGQAFTDAIRGDWGGKPLEDLQKGLAAALQRYPWMDGERVAALGASYGGYMINWIAGQWPDRFKCLVNHDGNLDERMAYFDTEELWFPEWDHMGTPWDNPEGYARHNPIDHVKNWKTPMLVIHGGQDFRVVDTQGISTFTALQRRNIPSKFLYFPDENHWVLKPHNSILWHETVIGWLNQWVKGAGTN